MKFHLRVCLKPTNDRGEFEFDGARFNKNIAENLFSLGHRTDNRERAFYIIRQPAHYNVVYMDLF